MQVFTQEISSAETESSGAERYMNELSAGVRKSPERRSHAPGIDVSIPYGEESGGLLDHFRKKIGRNKGGTDAGGAGEELQWQNNPAFEAEGEEFENPLYDEDEAREAEEQAHPLASVRNGDMKIASGHDQARVLSEQVINSEQRGFGLIRFKDGEFASVKSSVKALNAMLDQPYPGTDIGKQRADTQSILDQYLSTIETLEGYITHIHGKKGGRTPSGRARLELVTQLLGLLRQDHRMFGIASEQLSRGVNAGITSWDEILRNARAMDLTEDSAQLEITGAGTSRIIKRTTADEKTEYIKAEEKTLTEEGYVKEFLSMVGTASAEGAQLISECLSYFEQNPIMEADGPLSPQACMEKYFLPYYRNDSNVFLCGMPSKEKEQSDQEYRETQLDYVHRTLQNRIATEKTMGGFLTFINQDDDRALRFAETMAFLKKKNLEQSTSELARIENGSTISDRNESSSILAERLGAGDLIARSRSILMKNAAGDVVRANAMEGARGKPLPDWREEAEELMKADKKARAEGQKDGPELKISFAYTPHSLMKLNELMILDMISGQVDRNGGNYLVEIQKNPPGENGEAIWYITAVKGIDNDMAFGSMLYNMIVNHDSIGNLQGFTKAGVFKGEDGNYSRGQRQTMFYISRSTYEHIMNYTPSMAAYDQRHLRNRDEIAALQDRLEGVKGELKRLVESGQLTLADNEAQEQQGYNLSKEKMEHLTTGYYVEKSMIR